VLHKFPRPFRLPNRAARQVARPYRLDVKKWSAIDRIQPLNLDAQAADTHEAANGYSQSIRSHATVLGEYSNGRPVRTTTRPASTQLQWLVCVKMEIEHHLDVRYIVQPRNCSGRESFRE
jgi:hypothetical protein